MRMIGQKLPAMAMAILFTTAAAAATRLALFEGAALNGGTSGGYTLTLNPGNVFADGVITIGSQSGVKVARTDGSNFPSVNLSVVVRYANLTAPASGKYGVMADFYSSRTDVSPMDELGLAVGSDAKLVGVWCGKTWNSGTYKTATALSGTDTAYKTFVWTQNEGRTGGKVIGPVVYEDGADLSYGGCNKGLGDTVNYPKAVMVGGVATDYSASSASPKDLVNLTGLRIAGIAVYEGVMSAAEVAAFAWPTDPAYAKFADNPAVLTYDGAGTFHSAYYDLFDLCGFDTGVSYKGDASSGTTIPGQTGVISPSWHIFCSAMNKATAPGYVLRFAPGEGKTIDATFTPLTFGGMVVEAGATDNILYSQGTRATELGDKAGAHATWFVFNEDFIFNRQGQLTLFGDINFDVAAGKTANLNKARTGQRLVLDAATSGTLRLHGAGKLDVYNLEATGAVTLDYSDLPLARLTESAYLNGKLTIDATTALRLPAGAAAETPYKLATQINDADATYAGKTIYVGDASVTATLVVDSDAGTVAYRLPTVIPEGEVLELEDMSGLFQISADSKGTLRKVGDGETTLAANVVQHVNQDTVNLAAIEVAGGTLKLGNAAKFFSGANNRTGVPLTVTAGTLDLNGAYSWDTAAAGLLMGTAITLGGAEKTVVTNGAITAYTTDARRYTILRYVGADGANAPAEFAADFHGCFTGAARERDVEVGTGAQTGGYDLLLSGTWGLGGAGYYGGTRIYKTGSGTVLFTGEYNLPYLTVSAGTWIMGSANAIAASTTVADGATLDANGHDVALATLGGAGAVLNGASGTTPSLTLSGGGLFTGTLGRFAVTVNGGCLDLSRATLAAGTTFHFVMNENTVPGDGIVLPDGASFEMTASGTCPDAFEFNPATGRVMVKGGVPLLDDEFTWLPIGDSITEGEVHMGHPDRTADEGDLGGYRYQVWNLLESAGQRTRTAGYRTGHRGTVEDPATCRWAWHSGQYGGVITHENNGNHSCAAFSLDNTLAASGYPDVISVLLGINDLSFASGDDRQRAELIFPTWTNYVDRIAKARPDSKILAFALLPNGQGSMRHIIFNNMVAQARDENRPPFDNGNVILVNVSNMLSVASGAWDPSCFKSDKLHPNLKGARLFAQGAVKGSFRDILAELKAAKAKVVHVDNATEGFVTVRFNKAIATVSDAALTITGTTAAGEDIGTVELTGGTVDADDPRLVRFATDRAFTGGAYAVTFSATAMADKSATSLLPEGGAGFEADGRRVELLGTGAAENVAADYRTGFVKLQTVTLGDGEPNSYGNGRGDNYAGAGPTGGQVAVEPGVPADIARVAYYVELKRPGQAAQFVWASMDAAAFGYKTATVGVPTVATGMRKASVAKLQVFGNGVDLANTAAGDMSQTGIVEFTPWGWGGTDQSGYPKDVYGGRTGWNDTLEAAAGTLKGCMQVARATGIADADADTYGKFTAETVFAYNNFNTDDETDVGIGTMSSHHSDTSSNNATYTWDWTDFVKQTQFKKFAVNAYEVKKIEIWVAPTVEFSTAVTGGKAWSELLWTPASGGEPVASADLPPGTKLTVYAAGVAQLTFDVAVDVAELIVTNTAGTASVALSNALGGEPGVGLVRIAPTISELSVDWAWSQAIEIAEGQTFTMSVGEGETFAFGQVVSGAGTFAKAGAGTLVLNAVNTLAGGVDVRAGRLKLGNDSALGTGATDVKAGATIDMNGKKPLNEIFLAGDGTDGRGALVTDVAMGNSINTKIRLSADASWGGSAYYHFGAASDVRLNGFTFTKRGSNSFPVYNTVIHGPGAIVVAEGAFANNNGNNTLDGVDLVINEGATLDMTGGTSLTVSNFTCQGMISGSKAKLKVVGTLDCTDGATAFGPLELATGARLVCGADGISAGALTLGATLDVTMPGAKKGTVVMTVPAGPSYATKVTLNGVSRYGFANRDGKLTIIPNAPTMMTFL